MSTCTASSPYKPLPFIGTIMSMDEAQSRKDLGEAKLFHQMKFLTYPSMFLGRSFIGNPLTTIVPPKSFVEVVGHKL